MAATIGQRSRCDRGKIGCVLVSFDNQVVSAAYVGPSPNFAPAVAGATCSSWCPRGKKTDPSTLDQGWNDCVSCHAEQNAVARADFSRLKGGTGYITGTCCLMCSKLLAASGIKRVVMQVKSTDAHRHPARTIAFLENAGIEVVTVLD